jgi:serine/threonine protein kinase
VTSSNSLIPYKRIEVNKQQSRGEESIDSLKIDKRTRSSLDMAKLSRQRMAWLRTNMHIEEVYDVLETIGHGSMGEVTIVAKKKQQQPEQQQERRLYACKSVRTIRMTTKEIDEFINEIDVLRELVHPNIIQMFEIYATKHKMWVVTELCKGGDLGEYARRATQQDQPLSEDDVAHITEQILRAVAYMHQHSICHRDLKFENIMILDETNNNNDTSSTIVIKLIDFGLGSKFTKGSKMGRACGTVYTAAPEILLFRSSVGYTEKADIWSIGVLVYMLLTHGQYPFLKDREELHDRIKRDKLETADYSFPAEINNISSQGQTFVANCLKRYPGARWSASKALLFVQTEWIPSLQENTTNAAISGDFHAISCTSPIEEEQVERQTLEHSSHTSPNILSTVTPRMGQKKRSRIRMETSMLNGISAYASTHGEFKKRVLLAMAYQMDKTSISKLRDLFFEIDTDNIGTLTIDEFKGALNQMHADKHLSAATVCITQLLLLYRFLL